ncbi:MULTISPECIES: hypothetical protein [Gammaproteobacteria]|uniref:hypothetical protein n=1 Tax=Gammaproteobacteria TaxID=1236 RepID=UPI00178822BA|nr:hypothetical protein [Psychrobacter sp. FME13]MBE0442439.1 hypothetical protein [Psychrobacter sp. FME13]
MESDNTEQDTVIGDLGGVPVEIPRESVHLLQYNGDPGWGEARVGPIPERTYESKIFSFGFDIRYTDGTIYDGPNGKMYREYRQQEGLPDSPWVSVGVSSGKMYHGPGGIDRMGGGTLRGSSVYDPTATYAKLPETQFGLEVYASPGIDPETNTPWRENKYAEDVFIQRDGAGAIITYIKCSNRDVRHPPCIHRFDLEPEMGLDVRVSYSRHVLKDWQQIERVVRKAVLNFRKQ